MNTCLTTCVRLMVSLLCCLAFCTTATSCSKSNRHDAQLLSTNEEAVPQLRHELAPSGAQYVPKHPPLRLEEIPADTTIGLDFGIMLQQNRRVREAVQAAAREGKGLQGSILTSHGATDEDKLMILSLLERVDGFVPSAFGGDLFRFTSYIGVVVPGTIKGMRYNVYLVKAHNGSWMMLEVKRM